MDHLYISLYFMISNHSVNLKVFQLGRLQNALWGSAVFLALAWMISWLDYHLNSLSSSIPWMHAHAPTSAHVHLHTRTHPCTHKSTRSPACMHMHMHMHSHTCTRMHVHPRTHMRTAYPSARMHACTHKPRACTHVNACTCVHTHAISYVLFSGLYCICLHLVTILPCTFLLCCTVFACSDLTLLKLEISA